MIDQGLEKKPFAVHSLSWDYHDEVLVQEGGSSWSGGMISALIAGPLPQMEKLRVTSGACLGLSQRAAQRLSAEILKMHPCYCCYHQHSACLDYE